MHPRKRRAAAAAGCLGAAGMLGWGLYLSSQVSAAGLWEVLGPVGWAALFAGVCGLGALMGVGLGFLFCGGALVAPSRRLWEEERACQARPDAGSPPS